jgi:hypothetical protein
MTTSVGRAGGSARATLVVLSLCVVGHGVSRAEDGPAQFVESFGSRMQLTDGSVVEVVQKSTHAVDHHASTLFLKSSSGVLVAINSTDRTWGSMGVSLSMQSSQMTIRADLGFLEAGLAAPLSVRIGGNVYRSLLSEKPGSVELKAKRKLQAAVSKLPVAFLGNLRALYYLVDSNLPVAPAFALIPDLFEDPMPGVKVQSETVLKPEEIQEIIRQASPPKSSPSDETGQVRAPQATPSPR